MGSRGLEQKSQVGSPVRSPEHSRARSRSVRPQFRVVGLGGLWWSGVDGSGMFSDVGLEI